MPRFKSRRERLDREYIQGKQELEKAGQKLRRVCAWCGLVLEEGDPGAPTTHGCCQQCEEKLYYGSVMP